MAIAVAPAHADGGAGGTSPPFSGGTGGIDSATSTGGAGGDNFQGGGGGGAGTTGGKGGTSTASTVFGGPPVLGGAGGAAAGAAGADGASYPGGANGGGGGGGGGAHGSVQAGVPIGNVSGGAGGSGGNADIINSQDGAGGGGAGGWGAVVTGGGNLGTLSSTVTGGAGGGGGDGGNVRQSIGAQGGSGGIGLALAPGAGSAAPAITIDANAIGGGGGGGGYTRGVGGAGGSGGAAFSAGLNTVDANVTIIAGRTVAGGAGGSGGISYEAVAGPGTIGNQGPAGNPGGNGGTGLNGDPTGVGGAGAAGGLGVTFMATATLTNAGSIIGGNGGSGGSTRGGTGGYGGDGGQGGPGGPPGKGGNGGDGGFGGFGDAGGAGGTGGIAVMFAAAGTLFNTGTITAGAGGGAGQAVGGNGGLGGIGGFDIGGGGGIDGAGGQGGIVRGGSNGGDGGIAVMFAATGALSNTGTILGGVGGTGGDSIGGSGGASQGEGGGDGGDGSAGGNAGNGGIAVMFAGAGTLSNTGTITAGAGGSGGQSAGGGGGAGGVFNNNGENGGNGGNGSNGGTGGNGGTAVMFAGAGTLSNIGSIIGGAGGNGGQSTGGGGGFGGSGNGSVGQSGIGGAGGGGGSGVMFAGGGVLANTGNITGGAGGLGGMGSSLGAVGLGGAGVYGTDITVINSGSISGGLSGDGVTRANAVTFTSGANILELRAGFSFTGNVVDQTGNGTFQLGGGTAASFDISQLGTPQYQGFASFAKVGDSTWTLTGTSTFAGPVNVNAGTLSVEGNLASATSLTVNTGGALDGTGTVGNTVIASGGSFAPGNGTPGSSMMVMGNLAFQSGAIYLVALNSATASFANVTGAATLGGASVNAAFAAGPFVNISKTYTILSAGSVSGTFGSQVISNLPSGFQGSLRYDPTHAYLDLVLNFVPPSGSGLNRNQQNIANALTNSFTTAGSIPMAFGALTPTGLTQASGEVATGSQQTTFNAMNQFMGLMTDPFMNRGGGTGSAGATGYAEEAASAYAARKKNTDAFAMFTKAPLAPSFEQRWSVWTAGYGGSQTTDGNLALGSNNTTSSVYGTAVGADYLFSPNTVAGFALAGGGTNFSVNGSGSGRSDLFQAGAYVRHTEGAAYITAALAYGWQDITTDRIVTAGGFGHLRAEFDANAYSGRVESGYRFVTPLAGGIGITPYAAGQFTTFDLPAYAESVLAGSGAFALGYGARSVTDVRSELGIRTDKSYALADGILTLRSRFGWAHDYDPSRSVAATFQALPGASFVVNGAAQASDSALTTASAELKWRNGWSVAATFEGEFSKVTNSYAGKGVVRYAW
ncbi:uncharacterized protein with beta-barrel porin domain [Bradyrhizobium sp. S3.12.5]|uniref:autotransporter domain-containing protein n=1 Tax=Bradyrhizobium sp. S3.12.5 TaxID=3156386 RepID=UPI003396E11B